MVNYNTLFFIKCQLNSSILDRLSTYRDDVTTSLPMMAAARRPSMHIHTKFKAKLNAFEHLLKKVNNRTTKRKTKRKKRRHGENLICRDDLCTQDRFVKASVSNAHVHRTDLECPPGYGLGYEAGVHICEVNNEVLDMPSTTNIPAATELYNSPLPITSSSAPRTLQSATSSHSLKTRPPPTSTTTSTSTSTTTSTSTSTTPQPPTPTHLQHAANTAYLSSATVETVDDLKSRNNVITSVPFECPNGFQILNDRCVRVLEGLICPINTERVTLNGAATCVYTNDTLIHVSNAIEMPATEAMPLKCPPRHVVVTRGGDSFCVSNILPTTTRSICPPAHTPVTRGKGIVCISDKRQTTPLLPRCNEGEELVEMHNGHGCVTTAPIHSTISPTSIDDDTTECPAGLQPLRTSVGVICHFVSDAFIDTEHSVMKNEQDVDHKSSEPQGTSVRNINFKSSAVMDTGHDVKEIDQTTDHISSILKSNSVREIDFQSVDIMHNSKLRDPPTVSINMLHVSTRNRSSVPVKCNRGETLLDTPNGARCISNSDISDSRSHMDSRKNSRICPVGQEFVIIEGKQGCQFRKLPRTQINRTKKRRTGILRTPNLTQDYIFNHCPTGQVLSQGDTSFVCISTQLDITSFACAPNELIVLLVSDPIAPQSRFFSYSSIVGTRRNIPIASDLVCMPEEHTAINCLHGQKLVLGIESFLCIDPHEELIPLPVDTIPKCKSDETFVIDRGTVTCQPVTVYTGDLPCPKGYKDIQTSEGILCKAIRMNLECPFGYNFVHVNDRPRCIGLGNIIIYM